MEPRAPTSVVQILIPYAKEKKNAHPNDESTNVIFFVKVSPKAEELSADKHDRMKGSKNDNGQWQGSSARVSS